MSSEITIDDHSFFIDIAARRPTLRLRVDGREHDVYESPSKQGEFAFTISGVTYRGFRLVTPDAIWIRFQNRTYVSERTAASAKKNAQGGLEVRSEMPGTVVTVHVAEGSHVEEGDPLITLESMKLQLTINSDRKGEIARIYLNAGATFERGAVVLAYKETR